MTRKLVVLNVGGASCSYLEVDDQAFVMDIGSGIDFNPVTDFLKPYYSASLKSKTKDGKFGIDQLIISHPHEDHISCLPDFLKYFEPRLITCPNDKKAADNSENIIDWGLFFKEDEGKSLASDIIKMYREMYSQRDLPLRKAMNNRYGNTQYLYQIPPTEVASDEELVSESYANNISLVTYFTVNNYHILFPGDIMTNGFKRLLNRKEIGGEHTLHNGLLKSGIDILIAPHHGLESAFCVDMFDSLPSGKVRCLNIVSEKRNNPNENRDVDDRYASGDYCSGHNNLESTNGVEQNYCRKTSVGHICIDLSSDTILDVKILPNINDVIKWFSL